MAAPLEVIVSSDSGSQLWNITVFDLHSGSSLLSYRGGNSSARALTVLGGQYLLSAQLAKNFINVWEIQRKVSPPGHTRTQSITPAARHRRTGPTGGVAPEQKKLHQARKRRVGAGRCSANPDTPL